MQWKVLIADDEPKIRRGLHVQIERMGLPVFVAGEAEDGEMALKAAEELRPDILLVDINMPFLSGLDFIEALKRTRSDVIIIVVTGYEDFQYARRALSLNLHAYLLKPVDADELDKTLRSAVEELEARRERSRHFEWAIAQLERRREFLREEFLRDAAAGRLEDDEIRDFRAYFDFPAPIRMMLMMIAVRRPSDNEKPWQHLMLQYALQDALSSVAVRMRFSCLFSDDRGNILMLYDADASLDDQLASAVETAVGEQLGFAAHVAAEPVPSLTKLSAAYDTALERVLKATRLSPIVEAARRYIAENFQRAELGLPDVAGEFGIHPSYLSRLMKQELGMSFSKYLTTVRIAAAVQKMREPGARVRQVAEEVGYSAANYFSVAFKKMLGVSPAEYRAEEVSP